MPVLEVKLPKLHSGQAQVEREARRFNVVNCGRRWGKTKYGGRKLIEPALAGRPVGWFSPTYKMLAEVWREVAQRVAPITKSRNAQEHRIELITGGLIEMWSLENFDSIRGRRYQRVIIDEAAMVPALGEAWQAVIRPTLTDFRGDAFFLSTPKGRNFFWQCYQRGQDPLQPDWASWQMPTSSNPYIDPREIEAARRELPERTFAQEYLAIFLEDAGGVFRKVAQAAIWRPEGPKAGHVYIIGVDWGKQSDYSVFSVFDATIKRQVYLDRSNQIDYALQMGRLSVLNERYRPIAIIPELNSIGLPIAEQLQRMDMPIQPFTTTNASKAAVIDGLALALEREEVGLLDDEVQTAELQAFEQTRLPSGLMRYAAPEGMHDDTVIAGSLGWYGSSGAATLGYGESPLDDYRG